MANEISYNMSFSTTVGNVVAGGSFAGSANNATGYVNCTTQAVGTTAAQLSIGDVPAGSCQGFWVRFLGTGSTDTSSTCVISIDSGSTEVITTLTANGRPAFLPAISAAPYAKASVASCTIQVVATGS